MRRDRRAVVAASVLVLIVAACLASPLYDSWIGLDPLTANPGGQAEIEGKVVPLLQPNPHGFGVIPLGPTWSPGPYMLGVDGNGRDVAARLLRGGRNTLTISISAALLCCLLGTAIGVIAGYYRGVVDGVLSRALDVIWAFPVLLLAISLSAILFSANLDLGLFTIRSDSLSLPILIIGLVYVPYIARPIRGEVLSLRRREFVEAAIAGGQSDARILLREIVPNVISKVVVYLPLMVATAMLLESGLSFLALGVRPPEPSWGTMIRDGVDLLRTRPTIAIAPGFMIVVSVACLNLLGDAVRDAFDPHAKLREVST